MKIPEKLKRKYGKILEYVTLKKLKGKLYRNVCKLHTLRYQISFKISIRYKKFYNFFLQLHGSEEHTSSYIDPALLPKEYGGVMPLDEMKGKN